MMKSLIQWQGGFSNEWFQQVPISLLAACMTCVVFSQEPLPISLPDAAALNSTVRENLDGHYVLTDDIYLNNRFTG